MRVYWWMMAARADPSALHSCAIFIIFYHHIIIIIACHLYINFLAGLSLNYYIIRPAIFVDYLDFLDY